MVTVDYLEDTTIIITHKDNTHTETVYVTNQAGLAKTVEEILCAGKLNTEDIIPLLELYPARPTTNSGWAINKPPPTPKPNVIPPGQKPNG